MSGLYKPPVVFCLSRTAVKLSSFDFPLWGAGLHVLVVVIICASYQFWIETPTFCTSGSRQDIVCCRVAMQPHVRNVVQGREIHRLTLGRTGTWFSNSFRDLRGAARSVDFLAVVRVPASARTATGPACRHVEDWERCC